MKHLGMTTKNSGVGFFHWVCPRQVKSQFFHPWFLSIVGKVPTSPRSLSGSLEIFPITHTTTKKKFDNLVFIFLLLKFLNSSLGSLSKDEFVCICQT